MISMHCCANLKLPNSAERCAFDVIQTHLMRLAFECMSSFQGIQRRMHSAYRSNIKPRRIENGKRMTKQTAYNISGHIFNMFWRLNFTRIASKVPKSWWMGDGIVAVDTSARSLEWLTCRWNGPILTIAKLSRLLNDRFDVELFVLQLCDNNELLIESVSSAGKSNFVIIFCSFLKI